MINAVQLEVLNKLNHLAPPGPETPDPEKPGTPDPEKPGTPNPEKPEKNYRRQGRKCLWNHIWEHFL